jgi:hypothetical protein
MSVTENIILRPCFSIYVNVQTHKHELGEPTDGDQDNPTGLLAEYESFFGLSLFRKQGVEWRT